MLRLFLIAATIALAPAAYAADAQQMEENKKVVLQLYEAAINQKDFEAASNSWARVTFSTIHAPPMDRRG